MSKVKLYFDPPSGEGSREEFYYYNQSGIDEGLRIQHEYMTIGTTQGRADCIQEARVLSGIA